jgi:predicted phosphoadenosine phosphosulfate sulfurtransferase
MAKRPIGINVLEAAQGRIATVFDAFPRVYLSFSGGKDSAVLFHLTAEEARKRGRKFGVLIVDLEAQYAHTIAHVREMVDLYRDCIDLYWVALPIALRNAVSVYEPKWQCWDPDARAAWVREPDPQSITDPSAFPFFRRGMEFEDFVPEFGEWYSKGQPTACLVGIRTDESLNRYRTIASKTKTTFAGHAWTTKIFKTMVYNAYPIYDWKTADIWRYFSKTKLPYNHLYDLMHQAGLTIHQQRICQPYGDDQRKGLWLYHVIEPQTWSKIVARVSGVNSGAEFVQFPGNASGQVKVSKPDNHTWESFCEMLLNSMPPAMGEHYRNKVHVFLRWWAVRGHDPIPDEAEPALEAARKVPSWRRIAKMLLRNDFWAKGLSFSQTKDGFFYQQYLRRKKLEREYGSQYPGLDIKTPGKRRSLGARRKRAG